MPDRAYIESGTLTITNVQISDSGIYVCQAGSGPDSANQRVTVTVEGEIINVCNMHAFALTNRSIHSKAFSKSHRRKLGINISYTFYLISTFKPISIIILQEDRHRGNHKFHFPKM